MEQEGLDMLPEDWVML